MLADRGTVLEAVPGTATNQPDIVPIGVSVDQEMGVRRGFVLAHPGLDDRLIGKAREAQGEIAPDDVDAGGIDDAILARGIEWRPLPVRADLEATLIVGRHAPERLVVVDPGGQLI